jgi:uncharacterized phage protein (TIGR01671 family)
MRKIKFRGKRVDNGEWVIGHGITQKPVTQIIHDKKGTLDFHVEVIPETVGQFTGLHDENGKEIFEADIVETVYGAFAIEWNDDTCKIQFSNGMDINDGEMYGMTKTVIGNLFDNPELITQ